MWEGTIVWIQNEYTVMNNNNELAVVLVSCQNNKTLTKTVTIDGLNDTSTISQTAAFFLSSKSRAPKLSANPQHLPWTLSCPQF